LHRKFVGGQFARRAYGPAELDVTVLDGDVTTLADRDNGEGQPLISARAISSARQAGAVAASPEDAIDPVFTGGRVEYERWMEFARSGAAVRCVYDGWVLRPPEREEFLERFDNVCAEFGVDEQLKLAIPQHVRQGGRVDDIDRVQAGARLLRALSAAGL
jgi:hypothetical protein